MRYVKMSEQFIKSYVITEGGKYNKMKQSAKGKRKMKFEVNKELQTKH